MKSERKKIKMLIIFNYTIKKKTTTKEQLNIHTHTHARTTERKTAIEENLLDFKAINDRNHNKLFYFYHE